jgi:hypothetical protein
VRVIDVATAAFACTVDGGRFRFDVRADVVRARFAPTKKARHRRAFRCGNCSTAGVDQSSSLSINSP